MSIYLFGGKCVGKSTASALSSWADRDKHFRESQNLLIWKGPTWIINSPTPGPAQDKSHTMFPRALSKCFLSSGILGAMTFCGESGQSTTTFWGKNLFLLFHLKLPWHSFMLFSWVLSLVTKEQRSVTFKSSCLDFTGALTCVHCMLPLCWQCKSCHLAASAVISSPGYFSDHRNTSVSLCRVFVMLPASVCRLGTRPSHPCPTPSSMGTSVSWPWLWRLTTPSHWLKRWWLALSSAGRGVRSAARHIHNMSLGLRGLGHTCVQDVSGEGALGFHMLCTNGRRKLIYPVFLLWGYTQHSWNVFCSSYLLVISRPIQILASSKFCLYHCKGSVLQNVLFPVSLHFFPHFCRWRPSWQTPQLLWQPCLW